MTTPWQARRSTDGVSRTTPDASKHMQIGGPWVRACSSGRVGGQSFGDPFFLGWAGDVKAMHLRSTKDRHIMVVYMKSFQSLELGGEALRL